MKFNTFISNLGLYVVLFFFFFMGILSLINGNENNNCCEYENSIRTLSMALGISQISFAFLLWLVNANMVNKNFITMTIGFNLLVSFAGIFVVIDPHFETCRLNCSNFTYNYYITFGFQWIFYMVCCLGRILCHQIQRQ